MKNENKTTKIIPFIKSTQLGKTLGSDDIVYMLTMINEQPMRYSDIEKCKVNRHRQHFYMNN